MANEFEPARAFYGPLSDMPAPQTVGDKTLYIACDDNNTLYQVQSGNWVRTPAGNLSVTTLTATGAVQSHSRPVMELGTTDAGVIVPDTLITVYDSAGTPYQIPAKAV